MEFEANSGCKTSSEIEWELTVAPIKEKAYPERQGYREHSPTWCRIPRTLDDMSNEMESSCNSKLRKDGHSEMIKEELVGGRLYSK